MFDVGAIVRAATDYYLGSAPNRATPKQLRLLVDELEAITNDVVRDSFGIAPESDQWESDLASWRDRLRAYRAAVDAAEPDDRQAVLDTVTLPLLLGYYEDPSSYDVQKTPDIATPYSLANQLEVSDDWFRERHRRLVVDVMVGSSSAANKVPYVLTFAAGAATVLLLKAAIR